MSRDFFDTNILLYAIDRRDPTKQATAIDALAQGAAAGIGCVSTQVMQEFADTASRKFGLTCEEIEGQLRLTERRYRIIVTTPGLVFEALQIAARHQIRIYDALIVAAAEAAGCQRVLSEDLSHGQRYGSVTVHNPFLADQESPT